MRLYTPVDISPAPFRFDYQDEILLMGSCFSDNMGKIMEEEKFRVDINPFEDYLGKDAQIEKAVEVLLDELENWEPLPGTPAAPVKN